VSNNAQISDLVLPVAVVAVVGMMIFPLPPAALDALLMVNISFALVLLVSAVYLAEPATFTALPTILLLSTLFRLGLNISTTRQILGQGSAPDIVLAFGSFVVGGSLIVGVVVFSIITLVQFLVIAKGAERVAEVAARFTLDAMPGKQMSIDADVRSGIIGLEEAKEKRNDLQRESKLYGSLDGAMKFVKGDAIAGLLITLINISAGLIIGVSQLGLSFNEAIQRFTLFTVGDGLVSQIPALLIAVGAGIVITRVENKDGRFPGRDLFSQLGREPQALATTGIMLIILAMLPGLPMISFFLMGLVLIFLAYRGFSNKRLAERDEDEVKFKPRIFSAIVFRLSKEATLLLQQQRELPQLIQKVRGEIFELWGIIVPDVQFDIDRDLRGVSAWICLNGVKITQLSRVDENFSYTMAEGFREFLNMHLHELIDDTQTRILLEAHQPVAEDLINNVIPSIISVTALTTILRQLIIEKVSVRELRTILQAVTEYHLKEGTGVPYNEEKGKRPGEIRELLAEVRIHLSKSISRMITDDNWNLKAWILAAKLDQALCQAAFSGAPLSPGFIDSLTNVLRLKIAESKKEKFVVLTTKHARNTLSRLMMQELPNFYAIAVDELSAEVKLELVGEITLSEGILREAA
jgi:flagellar biosynthesis component FlhA